MGSEDAEEKVEKNYYSYYDTPDGQDMEKKMMVTSRYGLMVGAIFGTYDVLMYSHAVRFGHVLRRYAYHMVPLTAMGATFAAVANTVQNYRGQDDIWNYFIGGASCSPILAAYLRSGHALVPGAVVLGAIGIVKKTAIDSGATLLPVVEGGRRVAVNSWRNDYTFVVDPRDYCPCDPKGDKK